MTNFLLISLKCGIQVRELSIITTKKLVWLSSLTILIPSILGYGYQFRGPHYVFFFFLVLSCVSLLLKHSNQQL